MTTFAGDNPARTGHTRDDAPSPMQTLILANALWVRASYDYRWRRVHRFVLQDQGLDKLWRKLSFAYSPAAAPEEAEHSRLLRLTTPIAR